MIRKIYFASFKSEDISRDRERNARATKMPDNYMFEMSESRYFLVLLRKRITKQKEALVQEENKFILYI